MRRGGSQLSRDRSYLLVGHWALDLQPGGTFIAGGSVLYSGLMAHRLGWKVRVVTSGHSRWVVDEYLGEAALAIKPSPVDTVFENRYVQGRRYQRVLSVAPPLALEDIPSEWLSSQIIHLAPIMQDVPLELVLALSAPILAVTPQGWMRRVGPDGYVSAVPLPRAPEVLSRAVAVLSLDDLGEDWDLAREYGKLARALVVTLGARGAVLFERGVETHIPPVSARKVDPTGAGDVFAAAFFCKLADGMSAREAGLFASCAAALSVAGRGPSAVPQGDRVYELFEVVRARGA